MYEKFRVLVFDPGENTGWTNISIIVTNDKPLTYEFEGLTGGTSVRSHQKIGELFDIFFPDIVVFETFNMYPGMAKELSWNSFYPCEVIGVIKYLAEKKKIKIYGQSPSIKRYSGGIDGIWTTLRKTNENVTEHTKDSYLHLKYFLKNTFPKVLSGQK